MKYKWHLVLYSYKPCEFYILIISILKRWKFRNGRGKFQLWGEEKQGASELEIKGRIEFVHKITLDDRNLF